MRKKLSFLMAFIAMALYTNSVWAQTWTAPVIGVNLDDVNSETELYMYNVKADAFASSGMSWGTHAIVKELQNGDSKLSADVHRCSVSKPTDGQLQIMLNKRSYLGGGGPASTNDCWVDHGSNNVYMYNEVSTNVYTLKPTTATNDSYLDCSWKYGGHITFSATNGYGNTEWAFVLRSDVTSGKYLLYKAKKEMYDIYTALVEAGQDGTYAEALAIANVAYNDASATAETVNAATKVLLASVAPALTNDYLSANSLFKNPDMRGYGDDTDWGNGLNAFGDGIFESYHSSETITQKQTGLPNGFYAVEFIGIYRQDGGDAAPTLTLTSGSNSAKANLKALTEIDFGSCNGGNSWTSANKPNDKYTAGEALAHTDANVRIENFVVENGELTITVAMPSGSQWLLCQGFRIYYKAESLEAYSNSFKEVKKEAENVDKTNLSNGVALILSEALENAAIEQSDKNWYITHTAALESALEKAQKSINSNNLIRNGVPDDDLTGWSCTNSNTFHVNTWSTEGTKDGTNMVTPFIENWVGKPGPLGKGVISKTLEGVNSGYYVVSAEIRVYSESGEDPSGGAFFANDKKIDVAEWNPFTYNGMKGVHNHNLLVVKVGEDETLTFGFEVSDPTFNWVAIKNINISYIGAIDSEGVVTTASVENPFEGFIANETFDYYTAPWKSTTGVKSAITNNKKEAPFNVPTWENYSGEAFVGKMYQTIDNVPNGLYELRMSAFVNKLDEESQYVYANADKVYMTSSVPADYSVYTTVVDHKIEIGLAQNDAVANWVCIDNVSLIYYGSSTVDEVERDKLKAYLIQIEELIADAKAIDQDYLTEGIRNELGDAIQVGEAAYNSPTREGLENAIAKLEKIIPEAQFDKDLNTASRDNPLDVTHLLVNAKVANSTGWTGYRQGSGESYSGAPDGVYMDSWNGDGQHQYQQLSSLPNGLYTVKAAGRAATACTSAYIYINQAKVEIEKKGNQGNELGNGWAWYTTGYATVKEGKATVGFQTNTSSSQWAGADDFHLYFHGYFSGWILEPKSYEAGVNNAESETHKIDDELTIYTSYCHWGDELTIHNNPYKGSFYSSELSSAIKNIRFDATVDGAAEETLVVYGSNDGETWKQVAEVAAPCVEGMANFAGTAYNYFKVETKDLNKVGISKMMIELESTVELPLVVDVPAFSIAGGNLYEPASLQLSSEQGADIYWSTDGKEYVAYTDAIAIESTCTIYAYAEIAGVKSKVVSNVYVVSVAYENIAALLATEATVEGTPVTIEIAADITDIDGKQVVISDGTGMLTLSDEFIPEEYNEGGSISGTLRGVYKLVDGESVLAELDYTYIDYSNLGTNAPVMFDWTDKVATDKASWNAPGGPVTIDGVSMPEKYEETTATLGDMLWQTVTGLDNGKYVVELYANARYTPNRGFESAASDGQMNCVYLYANDVELSIPVVHNPDLNNGQSYTLEGVAVTDGTLKLGMTKKADGSNWHTIQIKSLYMLLTKDEALEYTKTKLMAAIEAAEAVSIPSKALTEAIANAKDVYANEVDYKAVQQMTTTLDNETRWSQYVTPMTGFIVNGTFDSNGVVSPWKSTTGAQNQTTANNQQGAFTGNFYENWNPDNYTGKIYQVVNNIPNGLYKLDICAFVSVFDASVQYVYANGDKKYLTSGVPTAYSVVTTVTDNRIEVGLEQASAVNNWMGIDNVSLTYYGESSCIELFNEAKAKAEPLLGKDMAPKALELLTNAYNADVDENDNAAILDAVAALEAAAVRAERAAEIQEWIAANEPSIINPLDATSLIVNPDMESGNISGWATITSSNSATANGNGNWKYNDGGSYANAEGTATLNKFQEAWVPSYTNLNKTSSLQTLIDIPNGIYTVSASVLAQAPDKVNGAYFVANDKKVAVASTNSEPKPYSIELEVTDNTLTIGVVGDYTTANWLAFDNVKLTYVGMPTDDVVYTMVQDTTDLVAGGKYVLMAQVDGGWVALSDQSGKIRVPSDTVEVGSVWKSLLTVADSVTTAPALFTGAPVALTLVSDTAGWKFYDELSEKYLHWESGNYLLSDSIGSAWTITFNKYGHNAIITHAKDAARVLQYNASSPRFCAYTSAQTPVYLFMEGDTKVAPEAPIVPSFTTIADVLAFEINNKVELVLNKAIITYLDGNNMSITDGVDTLAIYDYNIPANFVVEGALDGKLVATLSEYKGNKQLTVVDWSGVTFRPSTDWTFKVSTENTAWGGVYCATQYAPAITTVDGRTAQMVEKFEGTAATTGTLLSQTVTGLDNGIYTVVLYANALSTHLRDGFATDVTDGATDVAYVFANDVKAPITAAIATETATNGEYTLENVVVADGKLVLGLGKAKAGTNWHTIQIKSLTYVSDLGKNATFASGTIASIKEGEHYVFYTDAAGKQHFLHAAGQNNWTVGNEPMTMVFSAGNVTGDASNIPFAGFASFMESNGFYMSNAANADGTGAIKTESLTGNNAPKKRIWESQVFYKNAEGKYAIRMTNAEGTSWGANCFVNIDPATLAIASGNPSLADALFLWEIADGDDPRFSLGVLNALIEKAEAITDVFDKDAKAALDAAVAAAKKATASQVQAIKATLEAAIAAAETSVAYYKSLAKALAECEMILNKNANGYADFEAVVSAAKKEYTAATAAAETLAELQEAKAAYLVENEVEGLVNGDFSDGINGWTGDMATGNHNYWTNVNDGFAEKWTAAPGTLADLDFYQEISGLPAGTYTFMAYVNACQQGNDDTHEVTGVSVYANSNAVAVHTFNLDRNDANRAVGAELVMVTATIADGETLKVGMKVEATDANWVVMDNAKLYNFNAAGTGIVNLQNGDAAITVYTIDGKSIKTTANGVKNLEKGLYIVNGKKMYIK